MSRRTEVTKDSSRVTPADLAHRLGVTPLQVRRVLRDLCGTLKKQDRGPRWYLSEAEVADVTRTVRGRGTKAGRKRE